MPYITMYKGQVSKLVLTKHRKQHLEDGWTKEPSKTKSTPRRSKNRIKVKEVEVIKPDLAGPEDLTTIYEE